MKDPEQTMEIRKSKQQLLPSQAMLKKESINTTSTSSEASAMDEIRDLTDNFHSIWKIGSTDSNINTPKQVNQSCSSQISSSSTTPRSNVISPDSVGFTAGINTNDYVPSLSILSNMGKEGIQTRQKGSSIGFSMYHDLLINQPSASVELVLAATCEAIDFDIAEVWLRTGPKTHQLINSHLRPAALENSVRKELVDVYYGERSSERRHRLSPALCKRAKEAKDVVWVTTQTEIGAETLRVSISNVRTAVAVPVTHEISETNITFIYFSMKRNVMLLPTVEYIVHMSLSAAVASVNPLSQELYLKNRSYNNVIPSFSQSQTHGIQAKVVKRRKSITGAELNLKWNVLKSVEYLTDGGNSWIHTAIFNGKPCVVKTLKPECQDVAVAINEIEDELSIHAKLNHPNIVSLFGAGLTSKGVRFVVLERLDGGTLSQMLGYDTRIRDRRRRFWKRRSRSYTESLTHGRNIAVALSYLHEKAFPGSICLHRDLKPDNIGFTLDGTVKLIDFGLATIIDQKSANSNEVYEMSGETGSLRYMAPEVAACKPYNHKIDVYSFGVLLWELLAMKRPYEGMTRESYYERVVYGGERPLIPKKWPIEISKLIAECWSPDIATRPNFSEVVTRLDGIINKEKKVGVKKKIVALIDRHSTWF